MPGLPPEGRRYKRDSVHVSNRAVAAHTGNSSAAFCRMRGVDRLCDVRVTFQAGLFRDCQIAFADLNRFVEASSREVERMPEAIGRFGCVFADQAGWSMTIVAGRHSAMRGFQPTVVLFVHDVAIGAGSWIVG